MGRGRAEDHCHRRQSGRQQGGSLHGWHRWCQEFEADEPSAYLEALKQVATEGRGKVVAVGECGLDYDRLQFCPKDVQKKYFELQLDISEALKLPLFLHCRNAADDFVEILSRNRDRLCGGVVHSFDGSKNAAASILDLGYYIGINGCSLRTPENLEVAASIPADRLMLETDCPWCEIRPTHAGFNFVKTTFNAVKKEKWQASSLIKGRNEPCQIVQVLEALAGARNENANDLAEKIHANTMKCFFDRFA
ncbi:deoxyribonuclease TATDN1 isoform X2 [Bacillus rossius redtenbacheri]|uniref:deoxyribonuclease TATDN1 isoform X2 n=1 Tax=Bacillus rossius redtenbacheri TaxID=93214 RepID=UPI002FDD8A04